MRFYAGVLLLSLMLGKFDGAAAKAATVVPANKPDVLGLRIVAMRDAFERRDWRALSDARERITQSTSLNAPQSDARVLLPYVEYWWLLAQLGQSANSALTRSSEIEAFIDAHRETPYADALQRETLRALGKIDAWPQWQRMIERYAGDDTDIQCHGWRAALAATRAVPNGADVARAAGRALTEAKLLWEAARPASDACYQVFDELHAGQRLNAVEVWQRVRHLLDHGAITDARRSAPYASDNTSGFEPATGSINLDALRYLQRADGSAQLGGRANVELIVYALTRTARKDAARAAAWLSANQTRLPEEARRYAWAQIAVAGAMQQNTDAVDWFTNAAGTPLNDTQAGWMVRATLRAIGAGGRPPNGDETLTLWRIVKTGIACMSAAEQRDPTWRYWLARAEDALGNAPLAKTIRETLARESNFYGVLAAEEIGHKPRPNWQQSTPARADVDAFAASAGSQRALAFYRLDMRSEGLREWQYAIRGLSDPQLLAASEVARAADLPDRAINTSERTQTSHDFSQRFPLPHRESLAIQARQFQLDEAWVYGLIRQESRFIIDAKSRVGAIGLMQLMPATANWAAKQVGLKNFAVKRATDINTNLTLGSFYLRHVLDDLGHPVLATVAYNAGPGRARRWRADAALDGTIYAESIPFAETRDYVKKVMVNQWFYLQRLGVTNASLRSIMGVVPGKSSAKAGAIQPPALAAAASAP